jgi:uncharacterized OsmC-like protein
MHLSTARGVRISGLETRLSGDIDLRGFLGLDETVRSGFSRIDVQIAVRSEAPRTEIESLCELAWTRSPVFDMVAHGVPVTVSPLIEAAPTGAA